MIPTYVLQYQLWMITMIIIMCSCVTAKKTNRDPGNFVIALVVTVSIR